MTTMYPMTTTATPEMMYPTTPSPMSDYISVMPKSMPATRPYTTMTSPPAPTRHESMYNMNDQPHSSNFNRYERESRSDKSGRNGTKR